MGAWVDDLARRFGRGADGKLRFAGDSDNTSVMRFSDNTDVPGSTSIASGKGGLTEPVNKPEDWMRSLRSQKKGNSLVFGQSQSKPKEDMDVA